MENAPALVQGLVMARQEMALLALLWAAALGIVLVHKAATWEAVLWSVILLVQSAPYVASVVVSLVASLPARRRVVAAVTTAVPAPAPMVARTTEGV